MIKTYFSLLLIMCLSFLKNTNAQSNAIYNGDPSTGTLDGIPFTFSNPGNTNLFVASTDLSTNDFSGAPLSNSEAVLNVTDTDWSITFDSPVSNLIVYCKYWRTNIYEFDQPFIILSGSPNLIELPNNQIQTSSYTDGVIQFTTPITTLNASVISGGNAGYIYVGFGVINEPILPPPPFGINTQIYTGDDKTLANLEIDGENILWYDASTDGNVLSNAHPLTNQETYYASQTVNGVESTERFAVTVNRISDASQHLNASSLVSDLISTPSSNATSHWYETASNGTSLDSNTPLSNPIYHVEQHIPTTIETFLDSGLNTPAAIITQNDGKIIVANFGSNQIIRVDPDGSNPEILGSGFNQPQGLALLPDGRILIADRGNNAIKVMDADGGNIITLGSGFSQPQGVAIQDDGKIIVADTYNNAIKRMNPDGTNIENLGSGFAFPTDIAIQNDGKIVVTNWTDSTVKRMDSDGGNIEILGSGFFHPFAVSIQNNGDIIIADTDNSAIKRMHPDGSQIETLISSGLFGPYDVSLQNNENILIADSGNNEVKILSVEQISNRVPVNMVYTTDAPIGLSTQIYAGDFATLNDLTVNGNSIKWYDTLSEGNLLANTTLLSDETTYYASQTINNIESSRIAITVKRISDATQTLIPNSTIGDLITTPSLDATANWFINASGGTALTSDHIVSDAIYYVEQNLPDTVVPLRESGLNHPSAVAVQQDGTILIADTNSHSIRRMNADGSNLIQISNAVVSPTDIAIQNDGKIVISAFGSHEIKRMNPDGSNIETLGSGFINPTGVAIQNDGKIIVADFGSNSIKRMNSDGSNIEVLGLFIGPTGIAIQDDGKIIVVENQNHAIRRMNADGSNIETLGHGFSTPYHASILENGNILIADAGNNAVKLMSSDGVSVQSLGSGLNAPYSVIPYTNNSLLIAETGNHAIKTLNQGDISNRVAVTVSINTLSLNDYNLNNLRLIPNPASSDIKIQHLNDNNSFIIFDIQGRKVSEGQVNSQESIDISKLNSGSYLLYIKDKNLSLKFIKQ